LNRRSVLLLGGALLSAAAGWFLPRWLLVSQPSFVIACLLAAVQEALLFGFPALMLLRLRGFTAAQLKERLGRADPYYLGLTMVSAVSYTLAGSLIGALFYILLTSLGLKLSLPDVIMPANLTELAVAALTIGGVTAVCEEMMFRLALPELLGARLNRRAAALISSLLFALMHFNLIGIPTLIIFALFAHRLMARHDSLLLPILFHAMYNFSILVMNHKEAAPGFGMMLLCAGLFVLSARLLLKEENNAADRTRQ